MQSRAVWCYSEVAVITRTRFRDDENIQNFRQPRKKIKDAKVWGRIKYLGIGNLKERKKPNKQKSNLEGRGLITLCLLN